MEILHCITTIRMGGAEKQLLTLVREQVKLGLKVTIVYLKDAPELKEAFQKCGSTVIDELANKNIIFQLMWLKRFLKSKKIIVHAHLSRSELFCAFCKGDNYLVVTKHNTERFFPRAPYLISKKLARFVFSRANACITISYAVKNYLEEINEITRSIKTQMIHYGTSLQTKVSTQEIDALRSSLGIKKEYVLGTIARMVPQKNLSVLVKAFAIYNKRNDNSILILVGEGPLKSELYKLAKQLNIDRKIIWIPRTDKISQYLSILDVFVLPSSYEGFGLVLLEAMQAGTPVIAANNSAIPEVMGKEYPGLYSTDDIYKLVDMIVASEDQNFRNILTLQYQGRLSEFDSVKMAVKIIDSYERLTELEKSDRSLNG